MNQSTTIMRDDETSSERGRHHYQTEQVHESHFRDPYKRLTLFYDLFLRVIKALSLSLYP